MQPAVGGNHHAALKSSDHCLTHKHRALVPQSGSVHSPTNPPLSDASTSRVWFCVAWAGLLAEARAAAKEVAELKSRLAVAQVGEMAAAAEPSASGARVLVARLDDADAGSLPVSRLHVLSALECGWLLCLLLFPAFHRG